MESICSLNGVVKYAFAVLCICLVTALHAGATVRKADPDATLNVNFDKLGLVTVVSVLAQDKGIPVGYVNNGPDDGARITFSANGIKLKDLLVVLEQSFPDSVFEISENVLEVFPKKQDPIVEGFLCSSTERLDIRANNNWSFLRDAIYEAPSVRKFLEERRIEAVKAYSTHNDIAFSDEAIPPDPSTLTVKQILTKVVTEGTSSMWQISRYGKKNEKLLLSF